MAELLAGRYELVDRLGIQDGPERREQSGPGSGATADAVWRSWDHKAGGYVAAKVMQRATAAPLQRFVRESSPWLRHRHVVAPAGWAGVGDLVLFAMPLVRGGSAAELVSEVGPLPVQWAATLLDQLLDALETVHDRGIVHGDIRAARLLFEPNGIGPPMLRLAGFGSRPMDGDPRDDLSAVGAMAAGLLVGLGGLDGFAEQDGGDGSGGPRRTASAAWPLEHSAPLGIPAVFWEFLAQLTDGDLTAEEARPELEATGCLPGDWSRVHDDAMVETVDKLPPYPPGWGPRGPIAFAAPGLVRPDMPRSLDEQPAESGGSPVPRSDQPHAFESDHSSAVSRDMESASPASFGTAPSEMADASPPDAPSSDTPGADSRASRDTEPGERLFPERDEESDTAEQDVEPYVPDSPLAELLGERDAEDDTLGFGGVPVPPKHAEHRRVEPETGPADESAEPAETGPYGEPAASDDAGIADDPDRSEDSGYPEDAGHSQDTDPYGPMPELQLDSRRRWIPRPDLPALRDTLASALSRLTVLDPRRLVRRLLRLLPWRRPRLSDSVGRTQARTDPEAPRLPRPREAELSSDSFDGTPRTSRRPATWRERLRLSNLTDALPMVPTLTPRGAETLRTVGVSAMLVGAGLLVAAFAVLLFV